MSLLRTFVAVVLFAAAAQAQSFPDTQKVTSIALWPGTAPGSEGAPAMEHYQTYGDRGGRVFWDIAHPMVSAFYAKKPNGASVLVIPGGGYRAVYFGGGVETASWLNSLGIDAYVLKYRLPDEHHEKGYSVPLQDAQRAMRLIRAGVFAEPGGHANDPARIGVIGYSAGGHLAAILATRPDVKTYDPVDDSDLRSARPDFMILGYPPLPIPAELGGGPGETDRERLYKKYVFGSHVNAETPPAFIITGDADRNVSYTQSKRAAALLEEKGVPVELHIFHGAGHGFVLHGKGEEKVWPDLCAKWLRGRGIIP